MLNGGPRELRRILDMYEIATTRNRVLLCSSLYYPNIGGVENSLYHLSRSYRDRGTIPWILTSTGGDPRATGRQFEVRRIHGVPVLRYKFSSLAPIRTFRAWLALRVITRRRRFDAIIARDQQSALASVVGRRSAVYLVPGITAEQHRPKDRNPLRWMNHWFSVAIQELALRKVKQIAVFSTNMAKAIEAVGVGRQYHLVRPGVDADRFRPADGHNVKVRRAALGIPETAKVGVIVGRLTRLKRIDLAIEALALAPEEWWLLVVGDGPLRQELEDQATRLGIADRVVFIGKTSTPEEYFQLGDVYVMSSESETFGQVIIEAMACGLRVVAFDSELPGIETATNEIVPAEWLYKARSKSAAALRDAWVTVGEYRIAPEDVSVWTHKRYSWSALASSLVEICSQ